MNPLKKMISLLFVAIFLINLLPVAVAADDEAVLSSLGHRSTDTIMTMGSLEIVLSVPSSYSGTQIDLADGLNISYNTAWYKNVVASVSALATVDGSYVSLTVTYNHSDDPEGTPKSQTVYTVWVVRAPSIGPIFAGTIAKEILSSGNVSFSASDFSSNYTQNDGGALKYISVSGSNPSFGTLQLGGTNYVFGTQIDIGTIGQLTFSATAQGSVSYDISAYEDGSTTPIGNVVLTITSYSVPQIKMSINGNINKGATIHFNASFFDYYCDLNNVPLISVEITPTNTTYGTWYLGTTAFTTTKSVTAAQLGSLNFIANTPGTATFNWRVENKAGFSSLGNGALTITSQVLEIAPYVSNSSVLKGSTWTVSKEHFVYWSQSDLSYRISSDVLPYSSLIANDLIYSDLLSGALSYIKLTALPTTADGYLYLTTALPKNDTYGYPAIAANTAITANAVIPAAYINYLRLATKTTSTNTQVSFNWMATADLKVSTAVWSAAAAYSVPFTTGIPLIYTADMNIPLKLSSSDIIAQFQSQTGFGLSYVTFTLPDKNFGTMYYGYDVSIKKGTAVASTTKYYTAKNPNLSNLTFVPAADFIGTSSITYSAFTEDGRTLTGTIRITVQNSPAGTISLLMDKNDTVLFDAGIFQSAFQAATGKALSYVKFTQPASSYGTLYYDADTSLSGSALNFSSAYCVYSAPYLSLTSFTAAKNYTGSIPIYYTAYTATGAAYAGKLVITVIDSPAGIVTYSLPENGYVTLKGNDFFNEFISVTGSALSSATFALPAVTSGTLYYQYSTETQTGTKISSSTKYMVGTSPDISEITFVPAKDFVGTVVVAFTVLTPSGVSYAGKLKFIVYERSQTISYTTDTSSPILMRPGDFQSAFGLLSDGQTLSYVQFELPSVTYGKLYSNYVSSSSSGAVVTADKKYFINTSPYLSSIAFVPTEGYNGAFTLSYTGYTAEGTAYSGKIKVTVINNSKGTVTYETNSITPVTFNANDFVSAYQATGTLSHVVFSLPYSSYGTLYYGYTSASSYGSAVSTYSNYYVGATQSISNVTFVPNSNYTGVLAVNYTAYSTTGATSSGTVLINVKSSEIGTVTYATHINTPVLFNADDFNSVFLNKTGSSLNYVTFTLPSASYGQLFLGYVAPTSYASTVIASAKYYANFTPLLSNVSFVPKTGYTGTVTLSYTGYSASGKTFTGKININVGSSTTFTDVGTNYAWASDAIDALYQSGIVTGTGNNIFNPASSMARGDFVLMIARAYSLTGGTDNFTDVPKGSYYYNAIAAAKALGIVTGSNGDFSPDSAISRQDAMVIIMRALVAEGTPLTPGTTADLTGFSDVSDISSYAYTAVASLVKAGIVNGNGGMLYPKAMISRAEMALILYKILNM